MKLKPTEHTRITVTQDGIASTMLAHGHAFQIDLPGYESFVIHPRQDGVSVRMDGGLVHSEMQPAWLVTERRTGFHAGAGDSPKAAAQDLINKIESRGGVAKIEEIIQRNLRRDNAESN